MAELTGTAAPAVAEGAPGDKGLKADALGFTSSVVIGVASTAPGYSLAASLGLVVAAVGFQSPAIMWLSFVPMLLVATAYYYLNRVDPDCGTTFSWATKAFGPWVGWLGGWGIIVADVIVMANLADIAGRYSFLLVGADSAADSKYWVMLIGVIWIAVMTWICYIGIEVSAKSQWFLLGAEIITLFLFAVVALVKVYASPPEGSVRPSLSWLNPFEIDSTSALTAGLLVAIFIYWGWDSLVSVNEETEDKERTPGIAAVVSTILLLLIYVSVSFAAQAYAGTQYLIDNSDDVLSALGNQVLGWGHFLLIIAVLTSASASTQTTILPTTRTSLSMAAHRAIPQYFARIHPRYLTPSTSTIWMGVLSIVWYAALTVVSQNILFDSIAALGLMIAFYYGLSGYACIWFFRRNLKSAKGILLAGIAPLAGAVILTWVFVKSCIDLANPENSESGNSWLGLGPPLLIAVLFLILGIVVMLLQWRFEPGFFRRKAERANPELAL
ncbi:MAG TPA: APC family permease [Gaiellaceae bacterium]|jgi:amino acid transporter